MSVLHNTLSAKEMIFADTPSMQLVHIDSVQGGMDMAKSFPEMTGLKELLAKMTPNMGGQEGIISSGLDHIAGLNKGLTGSIAIS